jgi:probable HAF family extracellular repeat protein
VALTLWCCLPVSAQVTRIQVQILPFDPSGINDAGWIVGESPDLRAAIQHPGGRHLAPFRGDALEISNSGYAAASFIAADGNQHCGRWSLEHGLIDLTPQLQADQWCLARGINSRGDVVAIVHSWYQEPQSYVFARDGEATLLPTLGGVFTDARDINDRGEVVGNSETAAGSMRGFLWTPKRGIERLPFPDGDNGPTGIDVSAMNNRGDVVAVWQTPVGARAVVWERSGEFRIVHVPDGYLILQVVDINERGWIVGTASRVPGGETVPFVIVDDQFVDLYAATGAGLNGAGRALNDHGVVVGYSDAGGIKWTLTGSCR